MGKRRWQQLLLTGAEKRDQLQIRLVSRLDAPSTAAQQGHVAAARESGSQGAAEGVDSLLRAGADETIVDIDGGKAADMIGQHVEEEDHLAEDVERVRELLANAPADRAWRRRGYLLLCRAHADKVQQKKAISDTRDADTAQRTRSRDKLARTQVGDCRAAVGDGSVHELEGGEWVAVMSNVLGLEEEGLSRAIVGYLWSR